MATPKTKNEYNQECVYIGRRIRNDGKLVHAFEKIGPTASGGGEVMHFRGVKRCYIGHTYKCGESSIAAAPERVDVERIDNAEWEAADALVDARNAEKRAEAKLKQRASPKLKAAIEALKPLTRSLDYFERKALIEYLAAKSRAKS